jgi:hypothetical protein
MKDIVKRFLYVALPVLAAASDAMAQSAFRRPAGDSTRITPAFLTRSHAVPLPTGLRCPSTGDAVAGSTLAFMVLALPVAGVAAARADDGWRAFRWSVYPGGAWAYGLGAWFAMKKSPCHSTDALGWAYTPFITFAGALAEANTRRW